MQPMPGLLALAHVAPINPRQDGRRCGLAEAEGVLSLVDDLTGEADYIAALCGACIMANDAPQKEAFAAIAERLATRLAARLSLLPRGTRRAAAA